MREDRAATEREDHILDCYALLKERDERISRLLAMLSWIENHDPVLVDMARKRASEPLMGESEK